MRKTTSMMAQWRADTKEGTGLRFEQCKGGYFSTDDEYGLKVVGRTEQNTLSGKNLIPYPYYRTSASINGVTFTDAGDGSIIVNGTATDSITYLLYQNWNTETQIKLTPGTYTLSGCPPGGSTSEYYIQKCIGSIYGWYDDGFGYTFDISEEANNIEKIYIRIMSGCVCDKLVFKPQLELNSAKTSYEPYCGGIPSPNPGFPQELQCVKAGTKVKVLGSNLIRRVNGDLTAKHIEWLSNSSFKFIRTLGDTFFRLKAHLTNGKQYTLSYDVSYEGETTPPLWSFVIADTLSSTKISIKRGHQSITFTWNGNNGDVNINFDDEYKDESGNEITISNINLVEGDVDKPYAPYVSGGEIVVPCDLYEGDIWYPMSGRVEHHSKLIPLTGEETGWTKYISAPNHYQIYVGDNDYTTQCFTYHAISNYYPKRDGYMNEVVDYGVFSVDGERIRFKNIDIDTLEGWLAWVKNQYNNGAPLSVVYKLKTPVSEQNDEWKQPVFAPQGTVNVLQSPLALEADLEAAMLVRR